MTRYLVLLGLRWLPVGLIVPISVLLPLDRGLTLAQVGALAAVQGITVLLLELPTGGLSDALGRRPVLLLAGVADLVALTLLLLAHSVPAFFTYWLLRGVSRALDSGPLESWYVDRALARDPSADIETGLSRGAGVIGAAIATGALLGGGLVALGPAGAVDALVLPVVAALGLQVASVIGVLVLMAEVRTRSRAVGAVAAIRGALRLARRSRVVVALLAAEFLWCFGMPAFESLPPVRLNEMLGSADAASALMGPVSSAAWLAAGLGAAAIPLLARRLGTRWTGFVLRVVLGLAVVGMSLAGGVAGLVTGLMATYAVHGALNPVHSARLHREADAAHRASLISLNSMAGQPGSALGLVVLTAVAAHLSTGVAMLTGGLVLAAAAPLYLVRPRAARTPRWSFRVSANGV